MSGLMRVERVKAGGRGGVVDTVLFETDYEKCTNKIDSFFLSLLDIRDLFVTLQINK